MLKFELQVSLYRKWNLHTLIWVFCLFACLFCFLGSHLWFPGQESKLILPHLCLVLCVRLRTEVLYNFIHPIQKLTNHLPPFLLNKQVSVIIIIFWFLPSIASLKLKKKKRSMAISFFFFFLVKSIVLRDNSIPIWGASYFTQKTNERYQ